MRRARRRERQKRLQQELKHVFEAPEPLRKRAFLRALEQPAMSTPAFVAAQLGYIRRWVWALSALIFAVCATAALWLPAQMLWVVSAFVPLLSLTAVTESGRSVQYEMAELEMATRFSLRSVILARMGILGLENLALLAGLLPAGVCRLGFGVAQAGVYLLLPYLLTAFAGLWAVRRLRGRESVYCCAGIAACVSVLSAALQGSAPQLFERSALVWWAAGVLVLGAGTAGQCVRLVRESAVA